MIIPVDYFTYGDTESDSSQLSSLRPTESESCIFFYYDITLFITLFRLYFYSVPGWAADPTETKSTTI